MGSFVLPRLGRADLPTAARGDGVYIIADDGRRYLDGCGGAAVSCLGHSNAAVADAARAQLSALPYAHTHFFTSEAAEQLARQLAELAPAQINRAYLVCGGSEAVESALKLARQYHVARGEPQRRHIIGRWQSYHGNTLGALAAGGNRARRETFAPLLFDGARHISPCHYWRWGREGESPRQYGARMADELEDQIVALGGDTVAAFIAETVVGATLGAATAAPGYFARIRQICDRYGVLLILDEVMCGSGRTGTFFACEQEDNAGDGDAGGGVVPDIICIAKGLGAGAQPLGAMLCDERIYQTVAERDGGFRHGHTYLGHIAACAAGVATLGEIRRLLPRVRAQGDKLARRLRERLGGHRHVGDIRGRGLFLAVEFVAERGSKAPFAAARRAHAAVGRAAFARGLMVYAMGGGVDGAAGDHVLIAPPYIISDDEIDELADKLTAAVAEVLGD